MIAVLSFQPCSHPGTTKVVPPWKTCLLTSQESRAENSQQLRQAAYGFALGWDFKKALRASGMKAAVLNA